MEERLSVCLKELAEELQVPLEQLIRIVEEIKTNNHTTFRDIKFFSEIGFPILSIMRKRDYIVKSCLPSIFRRIYERFIKRKKICRAGDISYKELCDIIIKETTKWK